MKQTAPDSRLSQQTAAPGEAGEGSMDPLFLQKRCMIVCLSLNSADSPLSAVFLLLLAVYS